VKVYAFSNPLFLGLIYTDSNGSFTGQLQLPADLQPGLHNIQVIGYDANNQVKVLTVGVLVTETGEILAITGSNPIPLLIGALFLLLMGTVISRFAYRNNYEV
jgi:hypothetical protein